MRTGQDRVENRHEFMSVWFSGEGVNNVLNTENNYLHRILYHPHPASSHLLPSREKGQTTAIINQNISKPTKLPSGEKGKNNHYY